MSDTTYEVISADSHVIEPYDLWARRMPEKLRERAPKLTADETTDRINYDNGVPLQPVGALAGCYRDDDQQRWEGRWEEDVPRAAYDSDFRLSEIARDGVDAEVVYPTIGMQFFPIEDAEFQWALFRAYNDWLAEEFCALHPERFFGIAMVNPEDQDRAIAEMARAKEHGLVGVMIAMYSADDNPYHDPSFDRFWAAASEMQMPINLHLTTARSSKKLDFGPKHRYPTPGEMLQMATGIQPILVDLIAFGVFDRHPDLMLVSAENDAGWAAHLMEAQDYSWRRVHTMLGGPRSEHEPSYYFRRNIRMTFMRDRAAILGREIIGTDSMMWGNDFPHQTSTWPHSKQLFDQMFEGQPDEVRQAILCDNVRELYSI
jgi:predicted TIM-barrel fold metal-dependent hydrolase